MARNHFRDFLSGSCVAGRKLRAIGLSVVLLMLLATASRVSAQDVSFAPAVNYPVANGWSVATGDFNGDRVPDLAVAGSGYVRVLLGNGDGSFRGLDNIKVGVQLLSVAVGDFNGDGVPDLVVADRHGFLSGVSVLLGKGDGTFQAPRAFVVGSDATSVAVGKFRGAGMPDDLAVTGSGYVSVLLGIGDGNFQDPQSFVADSGPYSVAVGDFDGDGVPDLAVANFSSQNVSVLLGKGDGTFEAAMNFDGGGYYPSVAIGDFNGDNVLDLAISSINGVSVLLGKGDGSFQPAMNFAAGVLPWSVAVGDFNGDGLQDLAVANLGDCDDFSCVDSGFSVLLGNGDGSFQAAVNFDGSGGSRSVATADFNGDGLPDLAVAHSIPPGLSVLINNTTPLRFPSRPLSPPRP